MYLVLVEPNEMSSSRRFYS